TGNGTEKTSNEVEVKLVPREVGPGGAKFEVFKEQRLAGEASFTKNKLVSTKIPNIAEYEIIVKNTGKTKLKVEKLTDSECSSTPGEPEKPELDAGEEAVEFKCSRELPKAEIYTNIATVEANKKSKESNAVEVELKHEPVEGFEVTKQQRFAGEEHF